MCGYRWQYCRKTVSEGLVAYVIIQVGFVLQKIKWVVKTYFAFWGIYEIPVPCLNGYAWWVFTFLSLNVNIVSKIEQMCAHVSLCICVSCACITNIFFSHRLWDIKTCGKESCQLLNNLQNYLFSFSVSWNSLAADPISHSTQRSGCKKQYHNLLCLWVTKDAKYLPLVFLIHYLTVIHYFCLVISAETVITHNPFHIGCLNKL